MDIPGFLKKVFVLCGRTLEYALTGQSEFKITTSEFADHDIIRDLVVAKRLLDDLKLVLIERFDITVRKPVVIELITDDKRWSYTFSWLEGSLGKYTSHKMIDEKYHLVYLLSGLPIKRFKAILAHELTHAFLYEVQLYCTNRACREGLARWVEYKILLAEGETGEAEKLLRIKHWIYGKGISKVIEIEKQTGEKNLFNELRRLENRSEGDSTEPTNVA